MPEEPYKNRELDERFGGLDEKLDLILRQTTKTNGSVANINRWRERVNGGSMVAGVFMTIVVVPILSWAIYVLVNITSVIHQSVDEALSAYEIEKL